MAVSYPKHDYGGHQSPPWHAWIRGKWSVGWAGCVRIAAHLLSLLFFNTPYGVLGRLLCHRTGMMKQAKSIRFTGYARYSCVSVRDPDENLILLVREVGVAGYGRGKLSSRVSLPLVSGLLDPSGRNQDAGTPSAQTYR